MEERGFYVEVKSKWSLLSLEVGLDRVPARVRVLISSDEGGNENGLRWMLNRLSHPGFPRKRVLSNDVFMSVCVRVCVYECVCGVTVYMCVSLCVSSVSVCVYV